MRIKNYSRAIGLQRDCNTWRMAKWFGCALMLFDLSGQRTTAAPDDHQQVNVYCMAGEVQQILATRDGALEGLRQLVADASGLGH